MAPMTDARTTLGSGRARTTKPARARRARAGRARRGTPSSPATPRTRPRTTATLAPLTADRWVIPVASMASVRSPGVRLVSPMTSPGRRPRASAGASSTAARSPARSRSAPAATRPGGARSSGLPVAVATASSRPSGEAGRQPDRHRHGLVPSQPEQPLVPDEQHRGVGRAGASPAGHLDRPGPGGDPAGVPVGDGAGDRVARHDDDEAHPGPLPGEVVEVARRPDELVPDGGHLEGGDDDEHGGRQRPPP